MPIVYADTETESECCLKTHGTHRYAEHPTTDIQLFSYALEEGEVKLWSRKDGEPMPTELKAYFADPECVFMFHNAWFDRNVIENVLKIKLPIQRYRCSMAQALSHGLPGGLDKLGEALGIREDFKKVRDGKRLVQLFCKPRGHNPDGSYKWATPETHPEDWALYKEYCKTDTVAMREIIKKIPSWNYPKNPTELEYWFMDQTVNSRGMYTDLDLATNAMDAIELEQKNLAKRTSKMTNGEVETAGQRDAMLAHILSEYGVELPNMQKGVLQKLVDSEGTPLELRQLLEVRLSTCTTSTSKYKRIVNSTSADSRLRGTIQFSGAQRTQRDAGRMTQIQNYPSKNLLPPEETIAGIEAMKLGCSDILGYDTMHLATSSLRYTVTATPGNKLLVADLSNIEGRVLAWLAGEQWKLDAFRAYDEGNGPDLYKVACGKAIGIPPEEVTKSQRNAIGKVLELSMGYAGGVSAIVTFATSFGMVIKDFAEMVAPLIPDDVRKEADGFFDWMYGKDVDVAKKKAKAEGFPEDLWELYYEAKGTCGLPKEHFVPLDSLKRLWRREHPAICKFWKDIDEAVRMAVELPNRNFPFGNGCIARRSGRWVRLILPSGHNLCYPGMRIGKAKNIKDPSAEESTKGNDIVFKGVQQFTNKWADITTHGGKLTENCTQGLARDIFKRGQLLAERNELRVILPLHDELVCDVPDTSDFPVQILEDIMSDVPEWAEGLPLSAKGFEDYRYHKDYD